MKMQTKPFVVEHKVSRRPERHDEKSIWAGLDLAAVAENVASELAEDENSREERHHPSN